MTWRDNSPPGAESLPPRAPLDRSDTATGAADARRATAGPLAGMVSRAVSHERTGQAPLARDTRWALLGVIVLNLVGAALVTSWLRVDGWRWISYGGHWTAITIGMLASAAALISVGIRTRFATTTSTELGIIWAALAGTVISAGPLMIATGLVVLGTILIGAIIAAALAPSS